MLTSANSCAEGMEGAVPVSRSRLQSSSNDSLSSNALGVPYVASLVLGFFASTPRYNTE